MQVSVLHLWREDKDVIIITAQCRNRRLWELEELRKLSVKRSKVVVYSMMVTGHTLVPVEHIVIISVITINRAAVRCSNAERAS